MDPATAFVIIAILDVALMLTVVPRIFLRLLLGRRYLQRAKGLRRLLKGLSESPPRNQTTSLKEVSGPPTVPLGWPMSATPWYGWAPPTAPPVAGSPPIPAAPSATPAPQAGAEGQSRGGQHSGDVRAARGMHSELVSATIKKMLPFLPDANCRKLARQAVANPGIAAQIIVGQAKRRGIDLDPDEVVEFLTPPDPDAAPIPLGTPAEPAEGVT